MTGLSDMGYSPADIAVKLGSFARTFYDTYARGRGVENWVDKSPRYAEAPEVVLRLFPGARFVVLHRHPLDQIHSFTRGGSFRHPALDSRSWFDRTTATRSVLADEHETIIRAAHYWRDVTDRLLRFSAAHPGLTLTLGYEEMCRHPREALGQVLQHYGLDWSESVLEYHRHDHDIGREAGRVAGTRGFSASTGAWRSWPDEWSRDAWSICRTVAESVGYRHYAAELGGQTING